MIEKYLYSEEDSNALCEFLEPMLTVDMRKRATARGMIDHQWLEPSSSDEVVGEW
jgi:serine/threonine protein kinase